MEALREKMNVSLAVYLLPLKKRTMRNLHMLQVKLCRRNSNLPPPSVKRIAHGHRSEVFFSKTKALLIPASLYSNVPLSQNWNPQPMGKICAAARLAARTSATHDIS